MHFITGKAPIWDGSLAQQLSVCLVQTVQDEDRQRLELRRRHARDCALEGMAAFKAGERHTAAPAFEACVCWTLLTYCWGDQQLSTSLYNYGSSTASTEPLLAKKYLELAIQSAQDEAQKVKYRRKLQEVAELWAGTRGCQSPSAVQPSWGTEGTIVEVQELAAEMEAVAAKLRSLEVQMQAGEVLAPQEVTTKEQCQEWIWKRLGINNPWRGMQ
ncbi:unnamed protein product [Effrenium voratum]|uniref:Uncharacterized protein n=1 Tax=Effrenium voratum TaxID=2562239 RepID=A0AA36HSY2_9DINO|nr:unnamed protein product [Effrenium voratum]CAJ1459764.1 unnamed protein product [Effrenium voratum]